jgi:hypothetical protein
MHHPDNALPAGKALPTLIVVEPNARGVGGHYLDYVLSFETALRELGLEARMLAARDADPDIRRGFFIPVFTYGFWDGYPHRREVGLAKLVYRALCGTATRLYYHPKTNAWVHHRRRSLRGLAGRLLAAPMLGLTWLADRVIPIEAAAIHKARVLRAQRRLVSTSVRELEAELDRLGVTDPVLFFTTAGENELRVATRVLAQRPSASAILMIRRPLFYVSSGGDFDALLDVARKQALALEIAQAERTVGERVQYATDTEELTSLHNLLGLAAFETFPIPHIVTDTPKRDPGRIEISYLGDARTEKGFLQLPRVAEAIAASPHADKVRLFVQCNFNIPGGEPSVPDALQTLRASYRGLVTLQDAPLAREEYAAQISRSDIMLLLYDRNLYRHRSSGIVIEALSAGAAPVVPSGSWLESACCTMLSADRAAELQQYHETSRLELGMKGHGPRAIGGGGIALLPESAELILDSGDYYLPCQSRGELMFRLPAQLPDAIDVSFSTLMLVEGHIMDIEIDLLGPAGVPLSRLTRQRHVLAASSTKDAMGDPDRFAQLVRVPEGSRFLRIRFGNTYTMRNLVISGIRTIGLRRQAAVEPRPRGALLYGDVGEVPGLVADEIARRLRFPEDRHRPWPGREFHNPHQFGRMLLASMRRSRSGTPPTHA